MEDQFVALGESLLAAAQDVLEAVLQKVDAAALCRLKAASVAWCAHVRRELCNRLWVRLCRREGQPEPAGVDSITDLDVECLNDAGRPWEVVIAGRQLPQLARLHGYGFVVNVQAVREADLPSWVSPPGASSSSSSSSEEDDDDDDALLGGDALRSCIQGEGQPPDELLLAAVACAASRTVLDVPVPQLREDDAIGELDFSIFSIGVTVATLLGLMLPAATLRGTTLCGLNENGDGNYTAEGITKLCEGLKGSSVTSLDLRGNNIGVEGTAVLAAILKETKITTLDVADNDITGDAADQLANVVLEHASMTDFCGIPLTSLRENSITELDLDRKRIGEPEAIVLSKLLPCAVALTSLNLEGNEIRADGASALGTVLKETQITNLNLGKNQLCGIYVDRITGAIPGTYTADAITKLCEGLKGSIVTSLNLNSNHLGPEGGAAIAEGLKGNSTLQSLNVADNNITGDAADQLANVVLEHASMTDFCGIPLTSLRENSITELNLKAKGVGMPGAIVLSKLLPSAAALTSLNLDSNSLCGIDRFTGIHWCYTAESITKLCEGLKGSAVTSLSIAHNHIGDEGASALAAILKETQIITLDIGYNYIDYKGASALAAILKETMISNLKLHNNNLFNDARRLVSDSAGNGVEICF